MIRMLITRPNHDDTTHYLFKWSERLIDAANKKGISCSDFKGRKANRSDIEKFLEKQNPCFVVFNGHGSDDAVYGYNDKLLIKAEENDYLLKSRMVYCVSCNCAKVLGPKAVSAGAKCFIGYDDVFVFLTDSNYTCRALEDKCAQPFLESSNQITLSLLDGKSAVDAYEKSQATFRKWIEHFSRSDAPPGSEAIVSWLIWDMYCQKLEGDERARVCN